jgi:hypothetical protein
MQFEEEMSKIRFELAKQYIQERDYDKAREILETMPDNPSAQKWLTKLDEIDPPFPQIESSQFARKSDSFSSVPAKEKRMPQGHNPSLDEEVQKAQKGARIAGGLLSAMGVGLVLFMLIVNPLIRTHTSTYRSVTMSYPPSSISYIGTAVLVGLGLLLLCLGLHQIWQAGRTDKIRATLMKGKAKNIKRTGFMFLGMAVTFAFVGIFTKQTSQFGYSIIWAISGGIMLFYQLPKAEEFDRQQALLNQSEKQKRSDLYR